MTEIEWRVVAACPNYEVSNTGRVRRIIPAELRQLTNQRGYKLVSLPVGPNGKFKHVRVHRLVAVAFVGMPPQNKPEVNHKDCDPGNNHVDNLEWVNNAQNIDHAVQAGRLRNRANRKWGGVPPPRVRGESSPNAKLTDAQVEAIRRMRGTTSGGNVADQYNVSTSLISMIWRGTMRSDGSTVSPERISGWVKHPNGCSECGTKNRRHLARGMCEKCYYAWKHRTRKRPASPKRSQSGSANNMAKLSEEDVRAIRALRGQVSGRELAKRYGTSPSQVTLIQQKRAWRHLD